MKRLLVILVLASLCALSMLCVAQWRREFVLRSQIAELMQRWTQENRARVEAEQTVAQYAREIERLTALRNQLEEQMLRLTEEVDGRRADQSARGFSIAVLMNELIAQQVRAGELGRRLDSAMQRLQQLQNQAQSVAQKGGSSLRQANDSLRQLAAQRDEAIAKLNERTRQYNDLVRRYNAIVGKQP
jgi:chromosome segregation ATPase